MQPIHRLHSCFLSAHDLKSEHIGSLAPEPTCTPAGLANYYTKAAMIQGINYTSAVMACQNVFWEKSDLFIITGVFCGCQCYIYFVELTST